MKKLAKLAGIFAILAMIFGMISCGSDDDDGDNNSNTGGVLAQLPLSQFLLILLFSL